VLLRLKPYLPIFNQVWRLALPVIFTFLLQNLVQVVDIFMAGRLGPIEVAAVGMSNTVRLLVFLGILAVTSGAMSLAAQAKGARDPKQLSFVTRQALSLTLIMSITLSALGWFAAEPLLTFLNSGGDPKAVAIGTSYLQILFVGTVFLMANFSINSLMQGAGDAVTPLYLSAFVVVLNIIFNYLFIFGPGPLKAYGVPGVALGTIAARFIGTAIGIYILYSGKNVIKILPGTYRPNWRMFKDILSIGVPSGLQGIVRNTAQLLVVRIVTSTAAGTFGAAALAIGLQIEAFAFMPGIAISIASTSLVGQALGAWQTTDARLRGNVALALAVAIMTVTAIPIFIFAPQIVLLFEPSANPTVISAGTSYVRINILAQPVLAVAMVLNGALRGAGDTRPGLIGTIIGRWIIIVPLAYFLAIQQEMGVIGVWLALVTGTVVTAIYVSVRWWNRRWLDVALHKTQIYRSHLKDLPKASMATFLDTVRTPTMALPDATEHVSDDEVYYQLQEGQIHVAFSDDDFKIIKGLELLPKVQPKKPRTTPQPAFAHD